MSKERLPSLSELDIPVLDGWINLTSAAEILDVSRQYAHKIAQQGGFTTLHKIPGDRDVFIVKRSEVEALGLRRSLKEYEFDVL